jgi:signal peptidase I
MSNMRLIVQPIILAVGLAFAVRATLLGIYAIPSASMQPTLQVGDRILVTRYFSDQPARRGDVVVFRSPFGRDEVMVKRVVGIPGDLIETRAGRVIVSGHTLPEPYLPAGAITGGVTPQVVPADCYFVLGDNRVNSLDSREWGVVPRRLFVGRARIVLWSSATSSSKPRANATAVAQPHPSHPIGTERLFKAID